MTGAFPRLRRAVSQAPWAMRTLARHGRPGHLLHFFGQTPGDDLMCTAVLREMRVRGASNLWMMTRFPGLFEGNPDVDHVVAFDERMPSLTRRLGGRVWYAHYGGHDEAADRSPVPARHIIALMCEACGVRGPVNIRPYLHLRDAERAAGHLGARQIVLHSSGRSAFSAMRNKEWFPERLQQVADALRRDFTLVQLGSTGDPPIEGCLDLRGRTSMRESAAIIAASQMLLGQVGFLMHLARAVDRAAVIIYGGREHPSQSGYVCNTNLFTALPCAPCWRWNACDHPVPQACMRAISAEQVVDAVFALAAREKARGADPLSLERVDVPLDPALATREVVHSAQSGFGAADRR